MMNIKSKVFVALFTLFFITSGVMAYTHKFINATPYRLYLWADYQSAFCSNIVQRPLEPGQTSVEGAGICNVQNPRALVMEKEDTICSQDTLIEGEKERAVWARQYSGTYTGSDEWIIMGPIKLSGSGLQKSEANGEKKFYYQVSRLVD